MRLLAVLLLAALVPSLRPAQDPAPAAEAPKRPEPTAFEPGSPRAWMLLTSAVLFEQNGERHDLLAGGVIDFDLQVEHARILWSDWRIRDRKGLLEQIEQLEKDGDRDTLLANCETMAKLTPEEVKQRVAAATSDEMRAQLEAYVKHAPKVLAHPAGLIAWDHARAIALCRFGYTAEMLTEKEAWATIDRLARGLQKGHASWDELGELYCIGRELWDPTSPRKTWAAYRRLSEDPKSPWKSIEWKLDLTTQPPGKAAAPKQKG